MDRLLIVASIAVVAAFIVGAPVNLASLPAKKPSYPIEQKCSEELEPSRKDAGCDGKKLSDMLLKKTKRKARILYA